MYINNKKLSIIYKFMIVIIGIYGLYESCFKGIVSLEEHFGYYTNLSNLICILLYILLIIKLLFNLKIKVGKLKASATITIMITMIVYNIILRPFMTNMEGVMDLNSIGNYIVHLILPVMVVFDYLLFDKKGLSQKYDPFIWLLLPFMYIPFIFIRAYLGKIFTYTSSKYPYFFLDVDTFGIYQVILNILIMIIAIIILEYVCVFIDHKLKKFVKNVD